MGNQNHNKIKFLKMPQENDESRNCFPWLCYTNCYWNIERKIQEVLITATAANCVEREKSA